MDAFETIGFIGYGAMASRMGANLKKAGYSIVAYTPSGKGGTDTTIPFFSSPKAVAEKTNCVIICVPKDCDLATSTYGPEGVFAGLKKGSLVINTSTVSPEASETLYHYGKDRGIDVLDAPVSGSTPEAEAAQLIILAGGENQAFEKAQPIFNHIGRIALHAGPAGHGARLKLVVNGIMGATLAVIAEGVAYGEASGIERDTLYHALSELAVISPHHKRKLGLAQKKDFSPTFPGSLMLKDMGLLMNAALAVKAALPTMAVATQQLTRSTKAYPTQDYSALLGLVEKEE
ncbi:NAD(P)-dependent oxidoreductase [Entomobacter blattae]|uniref:2-(Hydroxymethyl)glutarate dehydrogenase n=1 Tax=Entomobacter blattae TaxID=2762277 RepID=A0A7H1NU97_9PROT|nr:NAD(P)-dependent oxidoreductase [Entomobacter blattae]QNT79357.1 2-(hydroxymethyl)glutarate dehydrogenase [Entomobacter blattae]